MEARHTFLLTDIVESTAKWSRHPEAMQRDLSRHDAVVRGAIIEAGGSPFKHTGDGMFAKFPSEAQALVAARKIQEGIANSKWEVPGGLLLKIGVLTGVATERLGDYFGPAMNMIARLVEIAHGGQSLLLAGEGTPSRIGLLELGPHCLPKIEGVHSIFQIVREGEPSFPAIDNDRVVRFGNLPHPGSDIIGRDEELDRLNAAVRQSQVVTLTGPGGVGKSRVALEFADRLTGEFRNGVLWTDLCCLECDADVESSLWAVVADGEPEPDGLHRALIGRLRPLNLVIFLDGAEPLVGEIARMVSDLRKEAANVRFVVTSREPLGIPGEQVIPIGPLPLPATEEVEDIALSPAVQLFLARAEARDFCPDAAQLRTIGKLTRRLEGIPLAIEIAASRMHSMSLDDLCKRLGDSLGILQTSRRTGEDRHRTLHATFEWSYELLSHDERAAFCLLGVFSGRFGLEAAVDLMRDKFAPIQSEDLVQSLVEKSMIVFDRTRPVASYTFLDSLRQYSGVKRRAEGLTETANIAHARVAGEFAREGSVRIRTNDAERAMVEIRERLPDLLQAANWLIDRPDVHLFEIVRLVWRYWYRQGRIREAIRDLEPIWGRLPSEGLSSVELDARRAHGWALYLAGRTTEASEIARRAVEDASRSGSVTDLAQARNLLAGSLLGSGETDEAIQYYLLALESGEDGLDPLARSRIQVNLAAAYLEAGRYDEALSVLTVSISRFREVGDRYGEAWVMVSMGTVLIGLGRLDDAEAMMRDSFELRTELGDQRGQAYALLGMSEIRLRRGEIELARKLWTQATHLVLDIEDIWAIAEVLLIRAKIGFESADWETVGRIVQVLESYPGGVNIGQTMRDKQFIEAAKGQASIPTGAPPDPFELAAALMEDGRPA